MTTSSAEEKKAPSLLPSQLNPNCFPKLRWRFLELITIPKVDVVESQESITLEEPAFECNPEPDRWKASLKTATIIAHIVWMVTQHRLPAYLQFRF